MGKPKTKRALKDNEAKAVLRMLRTSGQKLNLVAAADPRQEGRQGSRRARLLAQAHRRRRCKKTLESAIANAENNHGLDTDALVVAEAYVGDCAGDEALHGPWPRPRRPASRSHSRTSRSWFAKSRRPHNGSEDQPDRSAPRHQPHLGFAAGTRTRREYGKLLQEDLKIRETLLEDLKQAAVSKIVIERPHRKCRVSIHTARPGIVIGKKGADIDKIRAKVKKFTDSEVHINIVEVRKPETDANLVAQGIAQQLERRVAFRRAMKRAVQTAIRMGAGGIRVNVGGRLGGADIARTEWYREGRVPLHTLRADIDYGTAEAKTTYGIIGIKVWIFKGEVLEHDPIGP